MGHKLPSRTRARSRAVDVLYEAHVKDLDDPAGLYSLAKLRENETTAQTPLPSYAREILEGVSEHLERIDAALTTYSRAWSLHRMPEVDLAIMRVATWEILFNPDVDGPTAITAAMQIAQERSTDESPKFINGLLGTINDVRDVLTASSISQPETNDEPENPSVTGVSSEENQGNQGNQDEVKSEVKSGTSDNQEITPQLFDSTAKAAQEFARQTGGVLSQIDLEDLK